MKLRACMVNIVWDFKNIKTDIFNRGFMFGVEKIEEVNSSKKNEILGIEKEDTEWVTFTHYREMEKDGRIRQLAFRIEECSWFNSNINENVTLEIFTLYNNNLSVQLEYDKVSGYWYEPTYYIFRNEKLTANNDPKFSPTGIMGAGSFKIKVKSKDGKFEHLSPNINVLPSAISVENYEQMLKELLFIRDDLVINKDSKVKINTIEKYNLDEINKILDKLYIFLNRINKNPKVDLVKKWEQKSDNCIKKMSTRTLKEKILKPYRNKFTVPVYKESLDIYENQVIKYSLYTLKKKVDFYKDNYFKLQKSNFIEYKNYIDEANGIYNGDKKNLSEEELGFKGSIKDKMETFQNMQKNIELQKEKLEECSFKIKRLLELNFIKKVSFKKVNFKSSQIFANDKNYLMVWKSLKKLKESNLIYDSLGESFVLVRDTQNIYEYWCLFKIIHMLIKIQGWKLKNSYNIVQELNKYLNKKGSSKIEGFTVRLEHDVCILENDVCIKNKKIELEILFNKNILTNTGYGKYKTPDYTFKFIDGFEKYYVYMDAKYRNYREQGTTQWLKDIQDVAINKYINSFEGTDHCAIASFIIHSDGSDGRFVNYGGDYINGILSFNRPNHRYGSVTLLPDKSLNFLMLMRMIEEYHLGLDITCWNCGESKHISVEKKETSGHFSKYHCKCKSCGEFWVKTHCKNRGKHKLIKHLKNYHVTTDNNPWYVKCPAGCD